MKISVSKTEKFIRAVSFIVLLSIVLSVVSVMLEPKNNTAESGMLNPNAHGYLSEPDNSLDVIIIGNSDANSGFAPMRLWHEYGITSYVVGKGRLRAFGALDILNDVLKHQKPNLIILETDLFFTEGGISTYFKTCFNSFLYNAFPVFEYHNLWKTNSPKDYLKKPDYTGDFSTKGQLILHKTQAAVGGYRGYNNKDKSIPFYVTVFIDRFVEICKENNIELLFVEAPSMSSWGEKRHKLVKAYADSKGVPFIDYDRNPKSMNLDWKTDTRDGGNHLNHKGAAKLTKSLGKFIKKNYSIEDRRNNPDYAYWNDYYKEYCDFIKSGKNNYQER